MTPLFIKGKHSPLAEALTKVPIFKKHTQAEVPNSQSTHHLQT